MRETLGATARRSNLWRVAGWSLAALVLLLPLGAMQVTQEVNWTASDFVIAAVLIGGGGLALEVGLRASRSHAYRAAMGVLVVTVFLMVWLNAAVGIVGSEHNPINRLYDGVAVFAIAGAIAARLRARGMVRAVGAAVIVQAVVGAVSVAAAGSEPADAVGVAAINGVFVALLAGSAWLFGKAAQQAGEASPPS